MERYTGILKHLDYCSRIPKDELSTSHNAPINELVRAETISIIKVLSLMLGAFVENNPKQLVGFYSMAEAVQVAFKIEEEDFHEIPATSPGRNEKIAVGFIAENSEAVDQIPREIKKVDVSSAGASAAFLLSVLAIFRAAMKGKLIANCPLPPERIPRYELLYKNL
ncbi:hypothetical protein NC653_003086 [Populus alba x Populus x berolinensis]|uniref:Uncharacterized protein n=1 Tax=Populus alba x Populus x berolinensis TaxID=444605 RepID=A0AAD6WK40_9ROSI|nr:hypothetical protein NC653_003086 [Populus alba x Populus x berolinensis]